MDLEQAIGLCMAFPEVEETTPFGPQALVYKVAGKVFAITNPDDVPVWMNLKCEPTRAQDLRAEFEAVQPGYHMNKRHWNTVHIDALPHPLAEELIHHSYLQVVAGMKKVDRERIETAYRTQFER